MKVIILVGTVSLISIQCGVFGFDLISEISAKFQERSKDGYSDEYLEMPYKPTYSADPYDDAMKSVESMSRQLKIAGVESVEKALSVHNCSISQKKVWGILYYFVPEFRAEIARNLKMGLGDFDSKKFVISEDQLRSYCTEYYKCGAVSSEDLDAQKSGTITANTQKDIKTNCKEFFEYYYHEGQDNENRIQNIQKSELGADKYRNSTVDDSPYDIMSDLGNFARLLFEDAQQALQPVFYHLPMFKGSEDALKEYMQAREDGSYAYKSNGNGGSRNGGSAGGGGAGNGKQNLGGGLPGTTSDTPSSSIIPIPGGSRTLVVEAIDDLIEGLGAYSISNTESIGSKRICDDGDEEPVEIAVTEEKTRSVSVGDLGRDFNGLTLEEFVKAFNFVQDTVDGYSDLPVDKQEEIRKNSENVGGYTPSYSESQVEKDANKIKKCWESCDGLRIDQKMSCRLMCACGEIKSPIFDPEKTPGLGPIFLMKFCTVPAVDMKFSVGGRKIVSIEEGVKQIYAVVDKLSREGKLGMWTQQYNFLDSSTKKMKVADTFAFSIDVEFVDIAEKQTSQSVHYKKIKAKNNNKMNQKYNNISNPLEDPAYKNKYRGVYSYGNAAGNLGSAANADDVTQDQNISNIASKPLVNKSSDSDADRYVLISIEMDNWIEQQANLWISTLDYIQKLDEYAKALYDKRNVKK